MQPWPNLCGKLLQQQNGKTMTFSFPFSFWKIDIFRKKKFILNFPIFVKKKSKLFRIFSINLYLSWVIFLVFEKESSQSFIFKIFQSILNLSRKLTNNEKKLKKWRKLIQKIQEKFAKINTQHYSQQFAKLAVDWPYCLSALINISHLIWW